MKNYFKRQKEIRLRKWCVEQAREMTAKVMGGMGLTKLADDIYEWVTARPSE